MKIENASSEDRDGGHRQFPNRSSPFPEYYVAILMHFGNGSDGLPENDASRSRSSAILVRSLFTSPSLFTLLRFHGGADVILGPKG